MGILFYGDFILPKLVLNLMLLKLVLNLLTKRKKKIKIIVSIQMIVILNTKRGIKNEIRIRQNQQPHTKH